MLDSGLLKLQNIHISWCARWQSMLAKNLSMVLLKFIAVTKRLFHCVRNSDVALIRWRHNPLLDLEREKALAEHDIYEPFFPATLPE